MTTDRRDPTNPFAPTEHPGWMDDTPDNRRDALIAKVAQPIYEDLLASRGGPHTKSLCDWIDYKSRKYATAAIDLIRADVLEEAARVADLAHPFSSTAAARIEQLEAALLTGVCMLSEMGLDPREKCQMAYDYMSAALGNVHSIGHKSGSCPRERT